MTKFLNISTDTTLGGASPSDEVVSSQKALKTYIDNNSGGGGSYTAGTGIDITSDVISVTAPTLTNAASNNIQLNIKPAGGTANTTDRDGYSVVIGNKIKGSQYNDYGSIRIGYNINPDNEAYGIGIYMSSCCRQHSGITKTGGNIILNGAQHRVGNEGGKTGGIIINGYGVAYIGKSALKGAYSILINSSDNTSTNKPTALNADYTTFINSGYSTAVTITENNTFWWGNNNGYYKLVDTDGTIPEARLADTTNAAQGQVLTLDSNLNAVWAAAGGGGSSTLAGLTDVTITSATSGQVLVYDGSGWVNGTDTSTIDCGTM